MKKLSLAPMTFAALVCFGASQVQAKDPQQTVTFVTLGTGGGPIPRAKRSEPANAVVVGSDVYLFDVGDGVLRQLAAAGFALHQIKGVFISHHHVDHNGDLPMVLIDRWVFGNAKAIPVIGPLGTVDMVKSLPETFAATMVASQTLGPPLPSFVRSVAPQDLAMAMDEPTIIYQDTNIRVSAIANDHYHFPSGNPAAKTTQSYSFRIEAGGRSIVYSGDTGPSPNLEKLARGADLLVSEVIDLDATGVQFEPLHLPPPFLASIMQHLSLDHSTPEAVGKLANAAGVKEVVLTHLVPGADSERGVAGYTKGIGTHFKGRVRVANDLDRF